MIHQAPLAGLILTRRWSSFGTSAPRHSRLRVRRVKFVLQTVRREGTFEHRFGIWKMVSALLSLAAVVLSLACSPVVLTAQELLLVTTLSTNFPYNGNALGGVAVDMTGQCVRSGITIPRFGRLRPRENWAFLLVTRRMRATLTEQTRRRDSICQMAWPLTLLAMCLWQTGRIMSCVISRLLAW